MARRLWRETFSREDRRFLNRQVRPVLAILMVMILSLVALLGALYVPNLAPRLMELLAERPRLQGAGPARLMLEVSRIWYLALLGIFGLTCLGMGIALAYLLRSLIRCVGWNLRRQGELRELEEIQKQAELDEIRDLLDGETIQRAMKADPWLFPEEGRAPARRWTGELEERHQALSAGFALRHTALMLLLVGIPLAVMVPGLHGLLIVKEGVPELLRQTNEDIRLLEAGECPSFTVWLSPKARAVHLPGPYGSNQPELLTRYGAISQETGGEWVRIYVPEGMDFALDPDRLYDENRDTCWNGEHAQQYRVEYTPNLCFVISAEPAEARPCEPARPGAEKRERTWGP